MRPIAPEGGPDPARRQEQPHAAILEATRELMIISGWDKLTIEGIASRAGVGKQTIYRWWPTKGAILFEAFLGDQMGEPVELPDTGDLGADLRLILRETVAEFKDPGFNSVMRALLAEVQADSALEEDLKRRLIDPQKEATVARFEAAREAGQADPGIDPEVLGEMLFGPLLRRWLLGTGEVDDDFADQTAALVCKAAASVSDGPAKGN